MGKLVWTRDLLRAAGILVCFTLLAGCDQLGIDTPEKVAQRKGAEAKAIGAACRHAMRAIEDCYVLNPKAEKSSVFEGWREMDEYMRENKIEGIAPAVNRPVVLPKASATSEVNETSASDAVEGGAAAE
jgi:hypothetical protein